MTEAEAAAICSNERRERECVDYLVSSVIYSRQMAREIAGDESLNESEPEMLAALLAANVVFLNSHHWRHDWPKDAQETVALCFNCGDVFARACADAEGITHDEIPDLFDHWRKDANWGPAMWCIKKRKRMPQKAVEEAIRKSGIWDLDELDLMKSP